MTYDRCHIADGCGGDEACVALCPTPLALTPSEIQAAHSERSRRLLREERKERGKWGWLVADAREVIKQHPDWTIEISGDHRPRPFVPAPRQPSLIERIRLFRAGRLDESLDSLLTAVIEYIEAVEAER